MRTMPSPLLPPPPWRGCQLCDHGRGPEAQRVCTCPAAVGQRPRLVELVRRPHGGCGPEALHLSFPGLHA